MISNISQFGNSGNPGVLETPDRKASLLLTPHSASRTLRKCSECGSTSHLKQNCPKAPFCARYEFLGIYMFLQLIIFCFGICKK